MCFSSIRVAEYGLHYRNYIRYILRPKCTSIPPSFKGIEITDVKRPFLIIVGGVFLSIAIISLEILHNKLKNRLRLRKNAFI